MTRPIRFFQLAHPARLTLKGALILFLSFATAPEVGAEEPGPATDHAATDDEAQEKLRAERRERQKGAVEAQERRRAVRLQQQKEAAEARKARRPPEIPPPSPEHLEEFQNLSLILERGANPVHRARAARRLAVIEPRASAKPLMKALGDPDPRVVIAAIRAIHETRQVVAIPSMLSLRNHPDPRVRAELATVIEGKAVVTSQ